jgi:hypothetical protein
MINPSEAAEESLSSGNYVLKLRDRNKSILKPERLSHLVGGEGIYDFNISI